MTKFDRETQRRIVAEREAAERLAELARSELDRIRNLTSWHLLSPGARDAFRLAHVALLGAADAVAQVVRLAEPKHMPFTALARCVRGPTAAALADAEVSRWHAGSTMQELHEWLGMTEAQYARWVSDPSALDAILDEVMWGGS